MSRSPRYGGNWSPDSAGRAVQTRSRMRARDRAQVNANLRGCLTCLCPAAAFAPPAMPMHERAQRAVYVRPGSRGGAPFRPRGLRAAMVIAGMLLPATHASALWNDRLEVFVAQSITRDDNIFRLSEAIDPVPVTGSSSTADTYTTTNLGFRFDVPVSRQRFLAEWSWNDNRYERFSILDYTGHRGRAVWQWQAGNDLSGELGYAKTRSLASLANVQSGVQSSTPNPVDKRDAFVNAAYMLTPRWKLEGELTETRNANEAPEFRVNDVRISGTGATVSYVSPADNEVGVNLRVAEARYPVALLVAGDLIDNAYRQQNVALVTHWTITARSRLGAQLGRVERSYSQLPQRDFERTTFRAAYEWRATGKLTLTADAQNDISEIEEINTGYVFARGVALRSAFRLSEKIDIGGAFEYSDRDYLGEPGLVLGTVQPRNDRVRAIAVSASWRPLRSLWLDANARRETRSSSAAFGDYEVMIFGLTAGIRF
jgi:exopolysaccharide biosynthesis operon protein EpsL